MVQFFPDFYFKFPAAGKPSNFIFAHILGLFCPVWVSKTYLKVWKSCPSVFLHVTRFLEIHSTQFDEELRLSS